MASKISGAKTTPEPKATENAEVAETTQPSRYADEETAAKIAERLAVAGERGFSRPALMELTGMNGSAVWRAQHGRIHPGEVETVTAVLDRIEAGEISPPARANAGGGNRLTRAQLEERCTNLADKLRQVAEILDGAQGTKTVKDLRGVLDHARSVLGDPANAEQTGGAE